MKAIILGATGFIGSHVARLLVTEGIDVRVLSRSTSPSLALEGLKVERVTGDLDHPDSLRRGMNGCQVLFHVAGYYPLYSFDRKKQKELALRQMKNVLESAESAGIERIIYTSSMSTIGKTADGSPSDEETTYDPKHFTGLYYEIKRLQEEEALNAARGVGAYCNTPLPIVIVNPTGVFGDHDVKPTSGAIVVAIARRKAPLIFNAKMNVINARDVAHGQLAAMKRGKIGRRYILGGHNSSVWEVARLIARLAKVQPPIGRLPLFIGHAAAYTSELAGKMIGQPKPLIPRVGIDFLKHGMHYDISRAREELGLKTTPLEETFRQAIDWFREHGYI